MDTQNKSNGATIGAIIVILILILGAIYYYKSIRTKIINTDQPSEQQIQDLQTQGEEDDIGSIEKDLNNTNLDGIGNGVQ